MTLRSHHNRLEVQLTPCRIRRLRYPPHPTATAHITTVIPSRISSWLFLLEHGQPNRIGRTRYVVRSEQRRGRRRRRPMLRRTITVPFRLFVPQRPGIHGGPVR